MLLFIYVHNLRSHTLNAVPMKMIEHSEYRVAVSHSRGPSQKDGWSSQAVFWPCFLKSGTPKNACISRSPVESLKL